MRDLKTKLTLWILKLTPSDNLATDEQVVPAVQSTPKISEGALFLVCVVQPFTSIFSTRKEEHT